MKYGQKVKEVSGFVPHWSTPAALYTVQEEH